jgi:MFS family permease
VSDEIPQQRIHPRAAFQHRDFRLFQAGRFLFTIGWQMQGVAVGWQVYESTGSALNLGYVGLAQFLPAIGFSLLTGHVADRFDRRHVVMVCMATLALCSLGLMGLTMAGIAHLWLILAILFLIGTAHAFAGPASQALMPHLVPTEHFSNAVAWNSTVWQFAAILGPAVGGLVLKVGGGPAAVYAVDGAISIIALFFVLSLRTRLGRMEKAAASWNTLLAGVRYVWEKKVILGAITLDLFAVLLGGAVALLPVFAKDILHVGPQGFGILRGAPAIGAAVMAITIAHLPPMKRSGATMLWCVALFGLTTVVFGMSRNFALSVACLVILGASDMVSVVVRHTLVQIVTPHSMRGRVSAVNLVFIGASNQLGEFESGITAHWFGIVPAVVIGGIGTILVVATAAFLFPELRRFGRLDVAHAPEEAIRLPTEPAPSP